MFYKLPHILVYPLFVMHSVQKGVIKNIWTAIRKSNYYSICDFSLSLQTNVTDIYFDKQ